MLVMSFQAMLEEAAARGKKGHAGNIQRLESLLTAENMSQLSDYARVLCFLAFHPRGDAPVVDYIKAGALADDSGPDVLVLFTLDDPAPVPVSLEDESFGRWADLGLSANPSHRMIRALFDDRPTPVLPGLVVFENFAGDSDALYLPLGHLDTEHEVRTHLREVFSGVAHLGSGSKPGKFLDDLGMHWSRQELTYERSGRRPVREWLLGGFRAARDHYGDIVATIGLFG
ncbi:hypothetical protein [Actinomadura terrae]|uniref:hypothetical protein n=1 Tax=Actinomadura terrae TaxID=604353 RepID=UPI001FA7105C|nr:hypothetical protein [Actinomadura terrae]